MYFFMMAFSIQDFFYLGELLAFLDLHVHVHASNASFM